MPGQRWEKKKPSFAARRYQRPARRALPGPTVRVDSVRKDSVQKDSMAPIELPPLPVETATVADVTPPIEAAPLVVPQPPLFAELPEPPPEDARFQQASVYYQEGPDP